MLALARSTIAAHRPEAERQIVVEARERERSAGREDALELTEHCDALVAPADMLVQLDRRGRDDATVAQRQRADVGLQSEDRISARSRDELA
jgi:hypothetical protein